MNISYVIIYVWNLDLCRTKKPMCKKHHLKEHQQKNRSFYRFMWDEFSGECCPTSTIHRCESTNPGYDSPNIHQVHQPDPWKNNQGIFKTVCSPSNKRQ